MHVTHVASSMVFPLFDNSSTYYVTYTEYQPEKLMELTSNLIKNRDARALANFIKANGLTLTGSNKIVATSDDAKAHCKRQQMFYDQRQLIKKILLNS
jgi:hypothetical protein